MARRIVATALVAMLGLPLLAMFSGKASAQQRATCSQARAHCGTIEEHGRSEAYQRHQNKRQRTDAADGQDAQNDNHHHDLDQGKSLALGEQAGDRGGAGVHRFIHNCPFDGKALV